MKRGIDCACGHHMEGTSDTELFKKVRTHVDDVHPTLNLTNDDVDKMIRDKAYDLPESK